MKPGQIASGITGEAAHKRNRLAISRSFTSAFILLRYLTIIRDCRLGG